MKRNAVESFEYHLSGAMRKPDFCTCEKKAQISCAVTAQLISAFVFATQIIQSLFFLNLNFQASSYLLWLYRPVCVRPENPEDQFSHVTAHSFKEKKIKNSMNNIFILLTLLDKAYKICIKYH